MGQRGHGLPGQSSPSRAGGGVVADAFRSRLWPLPDAAVLLTVLAGVLVPLLGRRVDDSSSGVAARTGPGGGGPDAARSVLTAVTGSLITLTSLTSSLTVVTLQLLGGQLRSAGDDGAGEVPRIAVTVAFSFAFALASVVALVLFLAHLATEIRVQTIAATGPCGRSSAPGRSGRAPCSRCSSRRRRTGRCPCSPRARASSPRR